MNIKLPKQWKHWLQKANLNYYPRKMYCFEIVTYFYGKNRNFRINNLGQFQCSCPLEYFDRWANSVGASLDKIPSTEKEFIEAINYLIEASKDAK